MLESKIIEALTSNSSIIKNAETSHNRASITLVRFRGEREISIKISVLKRSPYTVAFVEGGDQMVSGVITSDAIPVSDALFNLVGDFASEWHNGRKTRAIRNYDHTCSVLDDFVKPDASEQAFTSI